MRIRGAHRRQRLTQTVEVLDFQQGLDFQEGLDFYSTRGSCQAFGYFIVISTKGDIVFP
jgi:hypothetical protein